MLSERCFKCHGPEKQQGALRLDSRAAVLKGGDTGPALVAGKPGESELIAAINYAEGGYQMPPTGKLPDAEIAILTKWVELGAPWPSEDTPQPEKKETFDLQARKQSYWAWQPISHPAVPPVAQPKG